MPQVSLDRAVIECARSEHLALLLDVDGTLIPFTASPEEAVLDRAGANLLDALAYTGIQVVLVSGRPRAMVEQLRTVVPSVWCSAEHGMWWRDDGDWEGPPIVDDLDPLAVALAELATTPGVLVERKTRGLCVHWRQVAPLEREFVVDATRSAFATWLASHSDYEELPGIETLELRHRSATKSTAVHRVRRLRPECRVMALGDDRTDEDMFGVLEPSEVGICVRNGRSRSTCARATLSDSVAVRRFLWWIVTSRSRRELSAPPLTVARGT